MRNPYRALLDLLPQRPLLVGDVTAVSGGVAKIQVPGGGVMTARGAATVGQRVFFRDGAIEGEAPSLSIEVIDV
jgi:hypothetical protein